MVKNQEGEEKKSKIKVSRESYKDVLNFLAFDSPYTASTISWLWDTIGRCVWWDLKSPKRYVCSTRITPQPGTFWIKNQTIWNFNTINYQCFLWNSLKMKKDPGIENPFSQSVWPHIQPLPIGKRKRKVNVEESAEERWKVSENNLYPLHNATQA